MTNETLKEKKYFKIPFIYTNAKIVSAPLDVNVLKGVEEDNRVELDVNFFKLVGGDNRVGLDFNIGREVKGDNSGINASIIRSGVDSVNKGSLSYSTFYDRINKVGDYAIAIQFSGIYNNAKEVSDKGAVLQFGLLNKIGDNYSLFVNAKGLKNIPEIIKRKFSRKKKSLENVLEEYK